MTNFLVFTVSHEICVKRKIFTRISIEIHKDLLYAN